MVAFTIISLESDIAQRLLGHADTLPSVLAGRAAANSQGRRIANAALRLLIDRHSPGIDCDIRVDTRGKPFAINRSRQPAPQVSISHTRGWIACAVADHPIGIDIEAHRPRDHAAIAEYAFGAQENAIVRDAGADGFYRIWTVREAIAKATGDGLALVTDRRDRAHGGPDEGRWTERAGGDTWLLAHMRPASSVSSAIAVLARDAATWKDEPFDEVRPNSLLDG